MSTSRPHPPEPAVNQEDVPLPDRTMRTLARIELRLKDGRYLIAFSHAAPRKPDA